MRIFLVRHGMSRANVDWSENRKVADHAIELTEEGKEQAKKAGEFLSTYFYKHLTQYTSDSLLGPTRARFPKIRIWNSPYQRTRQTRDQIISACRLPDLSRFAKDAGSPFFWHRHGNMEAHVEDYDDMKRLSRPKAGDSWFLDQKEHFLLHEQQFGIFDGLSDEQRREMYPAETEYYEKCKQFEGKVWAKLPMGESRIDVARRMHQAFGTFKRDEEKHEIENIVVVGHGTTNRCFTMAWMHLGPEWLEKEPNPKNCAIRLIEHGVDKGYIFEGFDHPEGFIHDHIPNPESED